MRTAQQLFDEITTHLRTQEKQSKTVEWNGNIRCRYRSPDGLKCAIGCVIPDAEYKPEMENKLIAALWGSGLFSEELEAELKPHHNLLREMQLIHDWTDPIYWEDRFQKAATQFNLIYTKPNDPTPSH